MIASGDYDTTPKNQFWDIAKDTLCLIKKECKNVTNTEESGVEGTFKHYD